MNNRILLVYKPDKGANAVRPAKIKNFLNNNDYEVIEYKIGDADNNHKKIVQSQQRNKKFIPKPIRNILFLISSLIQAAKIYNYAHKHNVRAVISETEQAGLMFLFPKKNMLFILDSPAPWVHEWKYSGDLSKIVFPIALKLEQFMYRRSTALCFHWENYTRFVIENVYNGKNIFTMNWACEQRTRKAAYSSRPRVVFLGKLDGYWNDTDLLSRLSKKYDIDVYGSPAPAEELKLKYKGYAPSTDVLSDYQFGLITLTQDDLRKQSFSSKHLEYMSYGLPVLTPEWRKDPTLEPYSLYYTEDSFEELLTFYSDEKVWKPFADKCYQTAVRWSWDQNLKPLLDILKK